MKKDEFKKRKIQQFYRNKLDHKKEKEKHGWEATVIMFIIFLMIILNSYFKAF